MLELLLKRCLLLLLSCQEVEQALLLSDCLLILNH
jgi:hypothetical protein